MTFPFPAFCPAVSRARIVHADNKVSATGASVYTFASTSLGATTHPVTGQARTGVVVFAAGVNVSGVTSIKIGAETATEILDFATAAGGNRAQVAAAVFTEAQMSGATTASIEVTFGTTMANALISVEALYGSGTSAYASNTNTPGGSGANTDTCDVPANGVLAAYAVATQSGSDPTDIDWTSVTENIPGGQSAGAGERIMQNSGYLETVAAQAAYSVTATPTNAEDSGLALVSFAPA